MHAGDVPDPVLFLNGIRLCCFALFPILSNHVLDNNKHLEQPPCICMPEDLYIWSQQGNIVMVSGDFTLHGFRITCARCYVMKNTRQDAQSTLQGLHDIRGCPRIARAMRAHYARTALYFLD